MIIPLVALAVDRILFWIQRQLFPYQYGGDGILHHALRAVLRVCEDLKLLIVRPASGNPRPTGTGKETAKQAQVEAMSQASTEIGAAVAAPTPVGMGQVVNRFHRPKEYGLPRVVDFRHVTKTYNAGQPNEFTAIRDVNFFVEDLPNKGEFICILGPSGCGKSTILRLIAGLPPQHPATSGEVLVQNEPVVGPGADRGMVFQDYTSFDHRSVLENITFGLECRGVRRSVAGGTRPPVDRARGAERGHRRREVSARAFRRHAAAGGHRPHADPPPADHPHGRALRGPRSADPLGHAGPGRVRSGGPPRPPSSS